MLSVPCVAVIIENPARQVLLNLRDDRDGLPFANHWTLPGGRVEMGETPDAAANRELREETVLVTALFFWKCYDRPMHEHSLVIQQCVFTGRVAQLIHA